jgi:hypothetical protein
MTEDLLSTCEAWGLGRVELVRGAFHERLTEHGVYAEGDTGGALAVFHVSTARGETAIGLRGNGEAVAERVPYDEAALLVDPSMNAQARTAEVESVLEGRAFPAAVALNKKLLEVVLGHGGWYLMQYSFDWRALREPGSMRIRLQRCIGGVHTRSDVFVAARPVGRILFGREAQA